MEATQLSLTFPPPASPNPDARSWCEVSNLARGTGFPGPVWLSLALADAIQAHPNQAGDAHDQRLYDILWLAYFQSTLEGGSATLTFSLDNAASQNSLRLRVEMHQRQARIGLLADF